MAAEIKTSLRVRARFRWIQLGGFGTAIKLCKGNYGNPPLFYSLMVNPGSRESGYRFARDFIISPREEGEGGRERGISCYFVVGWFLINFSIFRSIDINCCLYFEERRIYGLLENFK